MAETSLLHRPIKIVDRDGNPMGVVASPAEAITSGSVRLISRVIIRNDAGDYLLQRRALTSKTGSGKWDIAASGHNDDIDPSPRFAAVRELREEIGLSVARLVLVGEYYSEHPAVHPAFISRTYNMVYEGRYNGEIDTLELSPTEVCEVGWFADAEAKRMAGQDGVFMDGGADIVLGASA